MMGDNVRCEGSLAGDGPAPCLLSDLPVGVLEHMLSSMASEPGCSAIRGTCTWLRTAFDACNTRMVLKELPDFYPPGAQLSHVQQVLQVLDRCPFITSVDIEKSAQWLTWDQLLSSLSSQLCSRVKQLSLLRRDDVRDLAPIEALGPHLQHLNLFGCRRLQEKRQGPRLLDPLAACTNLSKLDLGFVAIASLSPLQACALLEDLSLQGCTMVSDLSPLSACVQLRRLNLQNCINVADLQPLAPCASLQYLICRGCNIQSLVPLYGLRKLRYLDLSHCLQVADLRPLSYCALEWLLLDDTLVADVAPLTACSMLRHLSLRGCVEVQDAAVLAACTALKHLDLQGTRMGG